VSLHVPPKWGPYGNRCPFPEPYLAYHLGSPVEEPSLQVPLIELPRIEMPPLLGPSFIHLSKSPLYELSSRFPGYLTYFDVLVDILKTS